ncbi:carbohydrate binding domain-containing protein [Aliagarivorans taiwanensis]|uniref:carbohydrate binding domain-containing protein n=1 Tax=Aliagarivorans taiwanensis TaxID=561966 RepID=UPI000408CECA|nr:carbohydrate binding domain-containing protein [Aliagarivorans taiwanensis]
MNRIYKGAISAAITLLLSWNVAALEVTLGSAWQGVSAGKDGWGNGEASFAISSSEATVRIDKAGTENYHIQLKRPSLKLKKSQEYLVEFTISANQPTTALVIVQKDYDDYAPFFIEEFEVGIEPQSFSYRFKMPKKDNNSAYSLLLGDAKPGTEFTVSAIRLSDQ